MSSPQKKTFNLYNNKSAKAKKHKNANLSSQSLSSMKKSHNFSEKYQINCNQSIDKKEKEKENNINNENEEEFSIIQSLWDDLGVNIDYQEEFKNYISDLKIEQQRNEILCYEKNHLRKFREALLKLSTEISNRENNVIKIKKYCKELDKFNLDKSSKELSSDIFENLQKVIKFYRINTVNVINKIMKVREISSYYELIKKWDPCLANRSYMYNKHYLLTMFNDIKFINNSILFNYIETDNGTKKTDLFFSNCKNIITNDNNKIPLPISTELQNAINKCKYIILQDTLLNNIKNDKKLIRQRKIISPKSFRIPSIKPKKNQSEISLINDKSEKKYYEMFGHNKINLSRTLYYLKRTMGNDYEKMFLNSNSKTADKKNMDVMNKYFSFGVPNSDKNGINVEYSDRNNQNNNKEKNIIEQINKNSEDIKDYKKDDNINNKKEEIINIKNNNEESTKKENNINIEDNTNKKNLDENKEDNKEENKEVIFSPIKKDNTEENKDEINNTKKENLFESEIDDKNVGSNNENDIKEQSNKNIIVLNEENTNNTNKDKDKNDTDLKNSNDIKNNDDNKIENNIKEEEKNEESIEHNTNPENEKKIIQDNIKKSEEEIIPENNIKKTNESIENIDKLLEKQKINSINKEIKQEEEKEEIEEDKNKNKKFNESVELEENKIENEDIEEKPRENVIKYENKDESNTDNINGIKEEVKNKKEDIDDLNQKEDRSLQEKTIEDEDNKKRENDKEKEALDGNINNSKEKEDNAPKVKLLQYREYTDEEKKKLNKEDSEDEFISVDYDKI